MTILASAAQVIRCFGPDCHAVTVTDLSQRLGMPKSNASRLLRAMRDVGLLETVGNTKRYRPGLMLAEVGRAYIRSSTLIERAAEVVARVSSACGHTGYVSIRDGVWVAAVTDHPGSNSLRVASNIGRRLPAAASATGRTLLARLTDEEVRRLHADGLSPPSPHAPQTVDELIVRVGAARRNGFAGSHEDATRGVDAVAVAVGDPRTSEEVSLCIVFPAATTGAVEREHVIMALRDGAADIAALTGDTLVMPASAAA
ncbi:MAG: IclR family transcriptional regulator [Beijerinckiaceae bacterium]